VIIRGFHGGDVKEQFLASQEGNYSTYLNVYQI